MHTYWTSLSLDLFAGSGVDPSRSSIAGSSLIFSKFTVMKYVVYFCCTIKILISNWPRTRKFRQLLQAGKTVVFDFARHDQALVTLVVQVLCYDWSKFDRWVHAEYLCSMLNLVHFWQLKLTEFFVNSWCFPLSFCLSFPLDVQNEISCYQESSVIHS